MQRSKVYLSVSYKTSKSVIWEVKKQLEDKGIEVLMYNKNQVYTPDKMIDAGLVIAIPPDITSGNQYVYNVSVGKGQYGEAEFALDHNLDHYMLVKGFDTFSKLSSIYSNCPDNWKENYGNMNLKGNFSVEEIFGISISNKQLLLI